MGNPRGVKRDAEVLEALEHRRLQAARLLRQGVRQSEVARRVGVHRQSVSRWAKQLATGGLASLKKAGRSGRKPRLCPADLRRIERKLKQGPEAQGYVTGLWTAQRVGRLIEQECGVHYHPSHVWRILRQMGWTAQRPSGRALERDEEAIRRWKDEPRDPPLGSRWPVLKKTRHAKAKP